MYFIDKKRYIKKSRLLCRSRLLCKKKRFGSETTTFGSAFVYYNDGGRDVRNNVRVLDEFFNTY
jgi:hypothetical protein